LTNTPVAATNLIPPVLTGVVWRFLLQKKSRLLFFEKVESLREGITLGNWQQQLNQVKMGNKGDEVWLIPRVFLLLFLAHFG